MFGDVTGTIFQQTEQVFATSNGQLGGSVLLLAVFFYETWRLQVGWQPFDPTGARKLKAGYLPGALKFDPLQQKAKLDEKGCGAGGASNRAAQQAVRAWCAGGCGGDDGVRSRGADAIADVIGALARQLARDAEQGAQ